MTTEPDLVNHPPHYRGNRFESIEVIEAYALGFHLGNAFKYIVRHAKKGGRQDLEKARWYLKRYLKNEDAFDAQQRAWRAVPGLPRASRPEIAADFGLSDKMRWAVEYILLQSDYTGDAWARKALEAVERELAEQPE